MRLSRLRDEVAEVLDEIPIDFGGGCSLSKGTVLADLLVSHRITRSVDIGVYRGRSFFPQAVAHRHTGGVVHGVDPYSSAEAHEVDHPELAEQIDQFVRTTDFDAVHDTVDAMRHRFGLAEHARIVRATSHDAARVLEGPFGLVHIDGNHDTAPVMQDVRDYVPLLAPGGFLVMDDISWTSVKPAVDLVSTQMTLLYARVDTFNDYAVFWNGSGRRKHLLRARVAAAGEG
ncbi:class I SAM-dependent methyltransferase [Actinotalea solisilvae]|uniref:class I SAM-dependent methyltransferase n=1 Tax=Actinotalea solisilvae TaxID=2072922 RepID=UPI0018F1A9CD|nr:class I SAM-dependent methyltransferase [Actinotalea solisilvae]